MNKALFSSKSDDWYTPDDFFQELDREFNFNLDPCADDFNHKCDKYFTKEQDGLLQSWGGHRVFCNPPYGKNIKHWVRKCFESDAELVVLLIPARTDTAYFHDYIYGKAEIRFIRGRLKFGGAENSAPFPSMLAIYRKQ